MIKELIKNNSIAYFILRPSYHFILKILDLIKSFLFLLVPSRGIKNYQKMQKRAYDGYTENFDDSKDLCVGSFDAHEKYPYEDYLLEHYDGDYGSALDFASGIGRMMGRMHAHFDIVDGVDLNSNNLEFAKTYLSSLGIKEERYSLFLSDGIGVKGINKKYDFIYSTIALQHICVHSVRTEIFKDLSRLLKDGGQSCFQMGFGWDNKINWFDNHYTARSTNAGCDVTIPNSDHLDAITKDFELMGFRDIKYELKISPHPKLGDRYHPIWIFMHMRK